MESILEKCGICLEPISPPFIMTVCKHAFCYECLDTRGKSTAFDCPLCHTPNPKWKEFSIFVQTLFGKSWTLVVQNNMTILELRRKFQKISGIPVEIGTWVLYGKLLENNKTLKDYNVKPNSAITLLQEMRGDIGVFVSRHFSELSFSKGQLVSLVWSLKKEKKIQHAPSKAPVLPNGKKSLIGLRNWKGLTLIQSPESTPRKQSIYQI